MSCLPLCRGSSGDAKNMGVVVTTGAAPPSSSSSSVPTSSPATTISSRRSSVAPAADRSGAFPTSATSNISHTSQSTTDMSPQVFEVDNIAPGGATNRKQSSANTGSTRYVRTTGLSRHTSRRSSSLPPPPQYTGAGNQQRRTSTSSTKSSRAVIHAGTALPKPYTYEPLTHSSIETVPLNTDYPAGSCTVNHAAGPAEPQQFYHRFKSTYGRPELNGRHGKTGYYDFRPIKVEVVRAKKKAGQGRRNVIRSMRVGKPARRSVGLSTLWAWDFPPSWVFRNDGGDGADGNLKRIGWIDCERPVEAAATPQKDGDQGSVAAGSVAGSVASCSSTFSVENMKRPGACVGFGGPFPYDRFLRPEQDPYYRAEIDDEDTCSDRNEGIDAKVHHHMDMLRFAALPYSFEQCWADELHFADFDGIKARESLPRPYAMPPLAPVTARKTDRRQYPTQELLRPTPEQLERAKKMHQAARIKARQDRNKMSRVSDWRHRSAALEAEINRRRSMRRDAVDIKEIIFDDDTISVDAEDISLPGVLKVMAALKPDNIAFGDWSAIQSDCEEKEVATDASTTVEGLNYLSDGSTILHYLERCQEDNEEKLAAEESVAELTENGLEEDSREDSAEIKLFLEDDNKEGSEDEDDEADDSLVFSKTSIAEVLASTACKVEEKRKSEASSVSTPTVDIIAESERAREEWAKLDGSSDSDNNKDNEGNDSVHSRSLTEKPGGTREESTLPHRTPRSRPLSIRLSAKKKKAWDNAWDEAGLVSDMVAVARWHGEEDVDAAQGSSELSGSQHIRKEDERQVKGESQIPTTTLPDKGGESGNGESTRKNNLSRTADETTKEQDDAPPGSPEVAQTLPPEDKIPLSPSPPRPNKKAQIVGVSLSQHLAATGAKGGTGMPKAGCEGSIRTMETACSTNPSEDDFVPSPYASIRKNVRPDALVGTSARSRRRALEAQFSKHPILSSKSTPDASQKGPAASLESARSLEVAILQSLKKKVDSSIGTSTTNMKAANTFDTAAMMERIQSERNRVAERSNSLRRLESAPQQVGASAPDWNVW